MLLKVLGTGVLALGLLFGQGAATQKAPAPPPAAAKTTLIDINSASEAELKTIPGVGDAYAAKIIKGRPYRSKDELVAKKIMTRAMYDKIKDGIIARQSK